MDILPGDRLSDIKAKYPNATFAEQKPAWLQPHQRLVQLTGPGIDGVLAIKLEHEVDSLALHLRQVTTKQANGTTLTGLEEWALAHYPGKLEALREQPPADPWEVEDIRWEPPRPILVAQASARYGKPDRDEVDEQFRRKLQWERKGITAFASTTGSVEVFIFEFTIGDRLCATEWSQGQKCDPLAPNALKPIEGSIKDQPAAKTRGKEGKARQ